MLNYMYSIVEIKTRYVNTYCWRNYKYYCEKNKDGIMEIRPEFKCVVKDTNGEPIPCFKFKMLVLKTSRCSTENSKTSGIPIEFDVEQERGFYPGYSIVPMCNQTSVKNILPTHLVDVINDGIVEAKCIEYFGLQRQKNESSWSDDLDYNGEDRYCLEFDVKHLKNISSSWGTINIWKWYFGLPRKVVRTTTCKVMSHTYDLDLDQVYDDTYNRTNKTHCRLLDNLTSVWLIARSKETQNYNDNNDNYTKLGQIHHALK
mgnify:CR=1 FL=1